MQINESIDLLCKSMVLFLYDRDLRHKRVNTRIEQFHILHAMKSISIGAIYFQIIHLIFLIGKLVPFSR